MTRRLLGCVLQIFVISALAFYLFSVAPGDFYSAELLNPQLHAPSIAKWREARGLNRPWAVRYGWWLASCARGEWGTSIAYDMPVTRLIAPRVSKTAAIVVPAWFAGWLMALAAAWRAARRKSRILEPAMTAANMLPEVIGASLLVWIAVLLRAPLGSAWIPSIALICAVFPLVFLHALGAFASARETNFVRLAASRMIPEARLWRKFIFPAAANPLISLIGPSLVAAVGSSLVIEAVTGWPGLGPLFLEAVQARDYELVQAVVVMLAACLTFTNLAADLLLYKTDPRIRLQDDRSY